MMTMTMPMAMTAPCMHAWSESITGQAWHLTPHHRNTTPHHTTTPLQQIHDRGSCDKVVYQADGTYVAARVPHVSSRPAQNRSL